MLGVFRRYHSPLSRLMVQQSAHVASILYSMGLLSSSSFDRITQNRRLILEEIEIMFSVNHPTPPYEMMVQFCEMIRRVTFSDSLPDAIMRTLGELVNLRHYIIF